ncbi:tetratricopeptide repeat protein (plasmid) [Allocoleopsis franciscana PCC 7113]|uniref:Tetratricopeptide repeat protein n=1 Tax=Allocoleopsis franciscana PCC 7113 TaxID=1173027 RepID=K9WRS2_9CYAN|nr:tetratricopeptide repeat protein [Allocoleopsis franciscana PCC 7113]
MQSIPPHGREHLHFANQFWADVRQAPDFGIFAEQVLKALIGESLEEFSRLTTIEKINKLVKHLNQQRCLLVIDNLEVLLDEQQWKDEGYQQFFSCWKEQGKNSTILLTSQEIPFSLQYESWLMLNGLEPREGGNFLSSLGVQSNPSESNEQDELENFSQMLDGHPLALRLAASYLRLYCKGKNILSQARQVGLVSFPSITKEASDEHRGEQTCLERLLQRHLERLTQNQYLSLIDLSVYRLPFTEDAATAMIGVTDLIEVLRVLEAFVQRSLLTKSGNLYQLQPSIQKYIQGIAGNQTVAHQKATHYYQKNIKSEPWSDLEDIRANLELFYHQCQFGSYLDAFTTTECVADFLDLKGYILQILNMYEHLQLNWQDDETNQKERNIIWNRLGYIRYYVGQASSAFQCYQQALNISFVIGEGRCEAIALKGLGDLHNKPGTFEQAIDYYQQALEIARQINEKDIEVDSLSGLGSVYFQRSQYEKSIDAYQKALQRHRTSGINTKRYRKTELSIILALGIAYKWQHDYGRAILVHREVLAIAQNIGDKEHEFDAYFGLGFIHFVQDKYSESIGYYREALKIAKDIGIQQKEAWILTDFGRICCACKQYPEALDYYKQALELNSTLGCQRGMAWTLMHQGSVYVGLEEYKEAIELYKQSINIYKAISLFREMIQALCLMGVAYDFIGDFNQANEIYQEAITVAQATEYGHYEAVSYLLQTISLAKPGDSLNALQSIQRAKILFQRMGIEDEIQHCDAVSQNYVFQVSSPSKLHFEIPDLPKLDLPEREDSTITKQSEQSSDSLSDYQQSAISSDVSFSLTIVFYLFISLFILANFIQGHLILGSIFLLVAVFFFFGQYLYSKRSQRK